MQFRSENEMLYEMLNYAQEINLIETSDELVTAVQQGQRTENQYVLDLATNAYVFSQLEQLISTMHDNLFLNSASGEYIDRFGNFVNVARSPAQAAQVEVKITAPISQSEDIIIPEGTEVINDSQLDLFIDYVTTEEVVLHANTTSVTVIAECINPGFVPRLEAGTVIGLNGFPLLNVTNESAGTHGKNIESDDDYRKRVFEWIENTQIGSDACIRNYLEQYSGISSFVLDPCYDGVGTLHIIADTLDSYLEQIRDDVYNNAMNATDIPPLVEKPTEITLDNISINAKLSTSNTISLDELKTLIAAQVKVYVEGGTTRIGTTLMGLGVGTSFEPSQCMQYLLTQFPELINIYCDDMSTIECDITEKYKVGEVSVAWIE